MPLHDPPLPDRRRHTSNKQPPRQKTSGSETSGSDVNVEPATLHTIMASIASWCEPLALAIRIFARLALWPFKTFGLLPLTMQAVLIAGFAGAWLILKCLPIVLELFSFSKWNNPFTNLYSSSMAKVEPSTLEELGFGRFPDVGGGFHADLATLLHKLDVKTFSSTSKAQNLLIRAALDMDNFTLQAMVHISSLHDSWGDGIRVGICNLERHPAGPENSDEKRRGCWVEQGLPHGTHNQPPRPGTCRHGSGYGNSFFQSQFPPFPFQ